ncbi:MAG: AbrB/MazE/SpoVT family DNA-binding domain-containing protein [Planctomycetota bacterium]|nr:AbrB/MazE/SpoVT family DNA-binding domain-containing protein [Planctomycetota bacterium]
MKATLTSKGQITIPIGIREKLGLKPGDQIEFDETATILVGRRVVNQAEWNLAMDAWRTSSRDALARHPWSDVSVAELIDDLHGGPTDSHEAVPGPLDLPSRFR